ncbi:MAG TPA: amino acid adenylation domain-containing protein [Solirubrobacteraceae bacterium]|jgi:amino acid adenylation domain-containing protein|nr:amino acid adenylation domain-containing protein [Solirubrobacteraceae bacterium]
MDGTDTSSAGFRLSPQQQQCFDRDCAPGVVQCAAVLDGPVDAAKLEAALGAAVARHEILRTVFVRPAGMRVPQQVIREEAAATLLTQPDTAAASEDEQALCELLEREAERELDPVQGPLVRALLAGAETQRALLLLSASAACADATSLLLLLRELCERYRESMQDGQEPLQYADYAEWRHSLLEGEEAETHEGLEHWRKQLEGTPPRPRLLFASAAETANSSRASSRVKLDGIALEELNGAAVGAGATVPVFLEAAWHALLARLSGEPELLVAGWCDGRAQPDLAQAIGPYEQPAPIRSRLRETTSFAEIVDQVRRARSAAVRWQDYGGGEELAAVANRAAAGWAFHTTAPMLSPVSKVLALRPASTGSAVMLALRTDGSSVTGAIHYDPTAIASEDVGELGRRFVTLLRGALADPSARVADLCILEPAERELILTRSAAPASGEEPAFVHEQFTRQAQLTPDRPAAIGPAGESLSYAELDVAANRLANHLEQLGVQAGQRVGICMERTPSTIVALLAVIKAGGAYVPLNHDHPQARIAHQLRDAEVRALITEQSLLESLPSFDGACVCVDRDAESIAARPAQEPVRSVKHGDLVYVMYTSGSTGAPKGVAITHANLANYAAAIGQRLGDGEEATARTFGVISSISTDLGNTSIFAPLVCGGAVRLISAEASMDGETLARELNGERLDVLKIAPSHLRALLAAGTEQALPREWLIVGGEALSWELVEATRALASDCRILNHYGPTETTIGCTTYPVDARPRPDALTVPIGFPLARTRAYVLDGSLEPAPVGVPGELCIAGEGVAAGYVGAEEQDTRRFTADPFADAGTGSPRMYRTGDRVRMLRDGAIEFLGRVDDQVKIRGFRVEPAEVEAALLGHTAVRQAAVCAEDDERGAVRLVAYLVAPQSPPAGELRSFLAEIVPDHMIPSAFMTVDALPLTASGKVDRQALANIAEVQAAREAEYVAPRDEVEQQIATIWEELLGVERVGALDDFFALGGHSLLATQATMRIRRTYGDVSLRALLAAPTVAALADVIRAAGNADAVGAGAR